MFKNKFTFSINHIIAITIGAPTFFLLDRFFSIPLLDGASLTLAYAALGLFAIAYGPIVGLLIGLIGHILVDITLLLGLSWSWIITSATVGVAYGFLLDPKMIKKSGFGSANVVRFIIGGLIIHMVLWGIIAPLLDVIFYSLPVNRSFAQGIVAGACNFALTSVVGTAFIFAYTKTRTKLKKNY